MSSRGTLLLIDDDSDICESLRLVLEDLGFNCVVAKNGKEGLALARTLAPTPKLILLDLMMPDLNGWEFLEQRQKVAVVAEIPVVVMTAAKNAPVDASQVLAVLIKPITYEQLVAVLGAEEPRPVTPGRVRGAGEPVE